MMTKRSHLDAFTAARAKKAKGGQRAPYTPVHDRRAVDVPKGVISAAVDVRDPYDDAGGRITVTCNLRGDTLAYLRDRKQIDEHQFHAGRHWQAVYEAACGTVPAMDTTKEPVDGGAIASDGLTDRRKQATKMLLAADLALQPEGAYMMRHIAASGRTIAQAAEARGISAKTCGKKFRACLDILAVEFGFADRRILTVPVNGV